jgi:hypothetical protein
MKKGKSVKSLIVWQFGISAVMVMSYATITALTKSQLAGFIVAGVLTLLVCGFKLAVQAGISHSTIPFATTAIANTLIPIMASMHTVSLPEDKFYAGVMYLGLVLMWNCIMRRSEYFTREHILFPIVAIFVQAIVIYAIFSEGSRGWLLSLSQTAR